MYFYIFIAEDCLILAHNLLVHYIHVYSRAHGRIYKYIYILHVFVFFVYKDLLMILFSSTNSRGLLTNLLYLNRYYNIVICVQRQ